MSGETRAAARQVLLDAIASQPRNHQRRIGPSELGTPCTHCLAAKLAGWDKTDVGAMWLPYIGTAVHLQLEYIFTLANGDATAAGRPPRWVTEQKVTVGTVDGQQITGSCDLYDTETATVVDFKCVGKTTLDKARASPSDTYRRQVHLYGRGHENAGRPVRDVAIWYLPRNAVDLDSGIWWTEPYDPAVAEQALARAEHVAAQIAALRPLGQAVLDGWIDGLDRAGGCYDCPRFPGNGSIPPGHHDPRAAFADLLG